MVPVQSFHGLSSLTLMSRFTRSKNPRGFVKKSTTAAKNNWAKLFSYEIRVQWFHLLIPQKKLRCAALKVPMARKDVLAAIDHIYQDGLGTKLELESGTIGMVHFSRKRNRRVEPELPGPSLGT